MTKFTTDWFSENIPIWTIVLKDYVGKENLWFVEVGAFEGRSTRWLLDNVLTASSSGIVVIDTFAGSLEHSEMKVDTTNLKQRFEENIADKRHQVHIIEGLSRLELRELPVDSYDVVYIDGSHQAVDVLQDIVLSWLLLKSGGILILDDYDWRFYDDPLLLPYPAIDAFLNLYQGRYGLVEKGMQVIVKKL